MARNVKKVGVASAKFTTTAFYILTCNFIPVHGYIDQNLHKDVFVCGYFKNCTFISAASNLLWHSKKSNYVFPRTRNIHDLYWQGISKNMELVLDLEINYAHPVE